MKKWFPSVGLEIHAQIISKGKIFSQGLARSRDSPTNTTISLFDISLPGTLPVINETCVKVGVRTALSLGATINTCSYFDRKHYYYPDLPGGYQITQHRVPLATGGQLHVPLINNKVKIRQIQLEQDSGKIIFGELTDNGIETLVDYNRAGVGLMEIITEPVLTNGEQASRFVGELRLLLRKIEACDGNMQDGSLRVDANVSVRSVDSDELGVKTELKNINGLKCLNKAIDYEISRHINVLESGGVINEETRSFDEKRNVTIATRGKSQYEDYRFMADHDLPPLVLNTAGIDDIATNMPELPAQQRTRLNNIYGISIEQIQVLENEDWAVEYFEEVTRLVPNVSVKLIYSWITSELYGLPSQSVSPQQLASLVLLLYEEKITGPIAKKIVKLMVDTEDSAQTIIDHLNVQQFSEEDIRQLCVSILESNPQLVEQYRGKGKKKVLGYLIGEVMTATNRESDPLTVKTLLLQLLDDL